MKNSTDRILTTHTGSLPRAQPLAEALSAEENGQPFDPAALARLKDAGVRDVVAHQRDSGVDVANDGEQPRVSYLTYVPLRMSGFGGESKRPQGRDLLEHPDFMERFRNRQSVGGVRARTFNAPQCVGDVHYEDLSSVTEECALFRTALDAAGKPFAETFLTAASPGAIAFCMMNAHYPSHRDYVFAVAREMKKEYAYIHAQGHVVQIDCPDFANEYSKYFSDKPMAQYLETIEIHAAALNEALAGIPKDRVRIHICHGNYEGPHTHDVALSHILPVFLKVNAEAFSIELANPRHGHEIGVLKGRFPKDAILIPGVIDSCTNYVEHPELVAERLERCVAAVGDRERVIAGTDCGFGTFAGSQNVAPSIVWEKLASMAEGARIATKRLWG
jgi:5-methyltetrahydropteroyltriglutamate--homocysteine methyltransferase